MMGDVVTLFKPAKTKKKPLTSRQLKSMEWLVLSTFQRELKYPYSLLANYFAYIGQLNVFHKIISRIEVTEDGIVFLTPHQ